MVIGPAFDAALTLAREAHATQTRKGTEIPYIAHLLAVAALVLEDGGDEEEAIAGLLHDAIEDGDGDPMRRRILDRFGARVAAIVEACADTDEDPKPSWREHKRPTCTTSTTTTCRRGRCACRLPTNPTTLRAIRDDLREPAASSGGGSTPDAPSISSGTNAVLPTSSSTRTLRPMRTTSTGSWGRSRRSRSASLTAGRSGSGSTTTSSTGLRRPAGFR